MATVISLIRKPTLRLSPVDDVVIAARPIKAGQASEQEQLSARQDIPAGHKMAVKGVAQAVKGLRDTKKYKEVLKACVEVNNLETLGDKMRDDMLGDLFEKYASDAVSVIKWKEIYQDAETVLDVCEDVVHIVESIIVKQA